MKFKIDSGVPIPQRNRLDGLWETMQDLKVGDSFVVPTNPGRTSVHVCAARIGIRVVTRSETENSIRVWRVE